MLFLVVFTRYDHYLFHGESPTTSMTFKSHYKLYKHLWKRLGVRSSKVTHCHRPSTSIRLQQMHAADSDIAHLALWLRDAQHTQYQLLHSPDVLVKEAGFQNQHSYFLWRAELDPEKYIPDLWKLVFAEIEEQLPRIKEVRQLYFLLRIDFFMIFAFLTCYFI